MVRKKSKSNAFLEDIAKTQKTAASFRNRRCSGNEADAYLAKIGEWNRRLSKNSNPVGRAKRGFGRSGNRK